MSSFVLNGTLAWGRRWQTLWAFANQKLFDGFLAVVYAAVCAWYCLERAPCAEAGGRDPHLLALLLVVRYIVGTVMDLLDVRRLSPSRVLEPALMLSQLVPDFAAKDGSSRSFPGDHALVALSVSLYFWSRAPRGSSSP
jgi:membrane-associated phospholipid phosphatase